MSGNRWVCSEMGHTVAAELTVRMSHPQPIWTYDLCTFDLGTHGGEIEVVSHKRDYSRWATATVAAAVLMWQAVAGAGVLFTFPDFSSTAGLTFVGAANTTTTSDGAVLRVTPASGSQSGAAYSTTP